MHRRARLLCTLTALTLLVPALPAVADHVTARPIDTACPENQVRLAGYVDVENSSQFELAISCLAEYGITRGRTPVSYDPTAPVLRQQMAQFLFRLGSRAGIQWDTTDAGFRDLGGLAHEATEAVNALANAGVAQGRSAQVFDPYDAVTRGQMASFLARLADAAGDDDVTAAADAFDDDEGLVHEPSIDRIAAVGVTAGRGSDRFFDPHSAVSREQMAAFLTRTLDRLVVRGSAVSRYDADVAPVAVTLDQQGALVEPGSALTGAVSGDRLRSVLIASPCVGSVTVGQEYSVPTDRQSPIGWCPVTVTVVLDNGRTLEHAFAIVIPGFTSRPEMVHAERVSTSSEAGYETSEVRFRYDSPAVLVPQVGDVSAFVLRPYAPLGPHAPTSVRQDGAQAVIATFGTREQPVGETELLQVSVATAIRGAMVDPLGRPTPVGTALLNPRSSSARAYTGPTWFPDLLTATPVGTSEGGDVLVELGFDAPLPVEGYGSYYYGVLLVDSRLARCAPPMRTTSQRRITVSCPAAAEAIARGVLLVGHVSASDAEPVASTVLTRRATDTPDLVAASAGPGQDQVTFTFDEPVNAGPPELFFADRPLPDLVEARSVQSSPTDPRQVVLTLHVPPGAGQATRATARAGAVISKATGRANAFDQLWFPARDPRVLPAGRTAAADLVRVSMEPDGTAVYEYDGYVYDQGPNVDVPGSQAQQDQDLRLYLADGTELLCRATAERRQAPAVENLSTTSLACRDFVVVETGAAATPDQVRAATGATARYNDPPGAGRPVEGARR